MRKPLPSVLILWSAVFVLALTVRANAQAAIPAQILPPGAAFTFDRAFSGRIIKAEIEPYLVVGGQEIAPIVNQQFLLLTIELTNNGTVPIAAPVGRISWLSTQDGTRSIRPAPITTSLNGDPRLGGNPTPITPGGTGRLLAVYQVSSGIDPSRLYYTVESDLANGRFVLATLPR